MPRSPTFQSSKRSNTIAAVVQSDVVLANGATGRGRTLARKAKTVRAKEISMIEAMLAGEPDADGLERTRKC